MRIWEIMESLPISMVKPYMGAWDRRYHDDLFNRFRRYWQDDRGYRIIYPFQARITTVDDESNQAVMERVCRTLNTLVEMTMLEEFWKAGPAYRFLPMWKRPDDFESGWRKYHQGYTEGVIAGQRIGKILQKSLTYLTKVKGDLALRLEENPKLEKDIGFSILSDKIDELSNSLPALLKDFNEDPYRKEDFTGQELQIVISRHPYDIAGMSTDRGWTSCTNLIDGQKKHYVMGFVKSHILIAYLCRKGDDDIRNPIARINLTVFVNPDDPKDYVLFQTDDSIYGQPSSMFLKKIKAMLRVVNGSKADTLYCGLPDEPYFSQYTYRVGGTYPERKS